MKNKITFLAPSWLLQTAVFVALLAAFGAFAQQARAQGIAPNVSNGDAYRNVAILGLDDETTFVRFANFRDEGPVRNYVEVYSLDEARTLGRFDLDVPAKASLQLSYLEIIGAAGLNHTAASAHDLALYVQNGREAQLWQHVQYDVRTESLLNASACSFAPAVDYIPDGNVLMNVHTTIINHIPSLITVHNFSDQAGTFEAKVYDSKTGALIGAVPFSLGARQSLNESAQWFQDQLGFTPARHQPHINIEVSATSTPNATVLVGHVLLNTRTGVSTNMSNVCPIHGGIITLDDPVEVEPKT